MSDLEVVVTFAHGARKALTRITLDDGDPEYELACTWIMACERAVAYGASARLVVTNHDCGRSVVLCYPPLSAAERARSDDAHPRSFREALAMLGR